MSILSGFWMVHFLALLFSGIAIRAMMFPDSVAGSFIVFLVAAALSGLLALASSKAVYRRLDRRPAQ